ncbi:MAG: ATP synthase subunit C [Candidatus Bathyarchaeia archaeon]
MRRSMLLAVGLIASALLIGGIAVTFAAQPAPVTNGGTGITDIGLGFIGAGIAMGLAGLGVGLGMGTASSAAVGAMTERPEVFGRTLIYIVFIEAIAIYAMVIALLLLIRAA